MNKYLSKIALFGTIGASLGFAYYFFIGCNTGTCAISGDPYISTAYGAFMGVVWGWGNKPETPSKKPQDRQQNTPQ